MERSKGYALMFLLGAFLAGGALGFSADRVIREGHRREMRGPRAYRQKLAEELKLTPQQQASVDSLIEQKHRQIVALYKPVRPQLDSIAVTARIVSDSTHAQIKRLLNPDQQAKLDKMRAGARRELADRRGGDTAGRPPAPPPFYHTIRTTKNAPVQCTGAFHFQELHVVGIGLSLTLPEVFLDLPFHLFSAPLDVLAGVIGRVAQVATNLAFGFLDGPFDLVLEASFV
jgi:Spy/CpxP family protein refolding chaperone